MAKPLIGKIKAINGGLLTLENGDTVIANLNASNKIGDTVRYSIMRSLKTVRMQAGATQWKEARAIGAQFYKQG